MDNDINVQPIIYPKQFNEVYALTSDKLSFDNYYKSIKITNNVKNANLLMNYPVVYIYYWFNEIDRKYEAYVGETNDLKRRTLQHYDSIFDESSIGFWERKLRNRKFYLIAIANNYFNKSLTLDIESRLINYLMCCDSISNVNNCRPNFQNKYYTDDKLDKIFPKIWSKLNKENNIVFLPEYKIKETAFFKASPFTKLKDKQILLKKQIIEIVLSCMNNNEHNLLMIEGRAGTGKTILLSNIFYDLCRYNFDDESDSINPFSLDCAIVVNHNETSKIYSGIIDKLNLSDKNDKRVYKSTEFLNNYNKNKIHSVDHNIYDVVFVDEAHLLYTQYTQGSFNKSNHIRSRKQIEDIINTAKLTIMIFDKKQIVRGEEYVPDSYYDYFKKKSIVEPLILDHQYRMKNSDSVKKWIDDFCYRGIVNQLSSAQNENYIKICRTPSELEQLIIEKSKNKDTKLSRMLATFDYEWKPYKNSNKNTLYEVKIGDWHRPWNYEYLLKRTSNYNEKSNDYSWAENPLTIKEIGSTFTIQGSDLHYAGVIIGQSVRFNNVKDCVDFSHIKECCKDKHITNLVTIINEDGTKSKYDVSEELYKNCLNVLMTRGVNGLFIYAENDDLRKKLLSCVK